MQPLVIGIGDCQVSDNREQMLVTYALGSCIAVLIYDPMAHVGGLLHYMLPDSSLDKDKAEKRPYMFANTGIPLLFHQAYKLGAVKSRLQVSVMGGAQVIESSDALNIGKRNHLALRRIFWKAGILIHHEDVGGTVSRTVRMELDSGRIVLRQGMIETVVAVGDQKGVHHGV